MAFQGFQKYGGHFSDQKKNACGSVVGLPGLPEVWGPFTLYSCVRSLWAKWQIGSLFSICACERCVCVVCFLGSVRERSVRKPQTVHALKHLRRISAPMRTELLLHGVTSWPTSWQPSGEGWKSSFCHLASKPWGWRQRRLQMHGDASCRHLARLHLLAAPELAHADP